MNTPEAARLNSLTLTAYEFAREAHADQLYGDLPYMVHVNEVATLANHLGYPEEVVAGSFLHDVLEDTPQTAEDLKVIGMPFVVVEGVIAVTSYPSESPNEKLLRARLHPLGRVIKMCDSSCNYSTAVKDSASDDPARRLRRLQRYGYYLGALLPNLPTPHQIEDYIASVQIEHRL